MRCILGFCVVLAAGSFAWAAETGGVASEAEFQTPTAPTGIPVVQPPGANAVQAAAANVYQNATAQPTTTPTLPATNMMPAGTYTAPMQPTTTYAAPGTTTTYPVYTYRAGTGRYGISNDDASVHNDRGAGHDHLWHTGSRLHHHPRPDDLCAGAA